MTNETRHLNIRSPLILVLTALIWGAAFVGQRAGMEFIGPFLFIALRMILGAATLAIAVLIGDAWGRRRGGRDAPVAVEARQTNDGLRGKRLIIAGIICGLVLFCSSSFQQIGLINVDAGKAGFLTTLYIVLVPILGILLRHKTHWNTWVAVLIAALGLYFLCVQEGLVILLGDLTVLVGAFGWACHILVIDHFVTKASRRDILRLCVTQFAVSALFGIVCSLIFDRFFPQGAFDLQAFVGALPAILYVGICSTGIAFTLQAVGQKGLSPAAASIIMSLESVFAVLTGMLVLHEVLTGREIIGCILMFAAVILSQLPVKGRSSPQGMPE